ncbi:MAG: hypothetical protein FWC47_14395 [Oscillospiraceae bacterium]|nr:hypothetical protein [Oscillospiraceae bacterium]
MIINSVSGPLDTSELGVTLMHEHIIILEPSLRFAYSNDWINKDDICNQFAEKIGRIKKFGFKTLVDPTPINLGRDVVIAKEAAERAGIQVIVSTGVYYMEALWMDMRVDPDYTAELWIRDIETGIQGTDIKAAFIKCATEAKPGITESNKNLLKAAARASKKTGAPIYTHSNPIGELGLYQQEELFKEGVSPHKIVIGHSFDTCDTDYVRRLIKNGTYVGCDRIGYETLAPIEKLAHCVKELCNEGYSKYIMLSHDSMSTSDLAFALTPFKRDPSKNRLLGGYHIIFESFLPRLRELGVSEDQIDDMMVKNPRRYFEGRL